MHHYRKLAYLVFSVKFCYYHGNGRFRFVHCMTIRASLFLCCVVVSQALSQPSEPVVLLFAGDVTLARHIDTQVGDNTGYVFQRWGSVRPYDIFMVNLENPVTESNEKVEKEYNFKMSPKYFRVLRDGGINIVNAANNHIADYGRSGIFDTMRSLDSAGIRYVGIGKNLREARKPVILSLKGRKVGFLGYHGGDRFAATEDSAGIAPRFQGYIVEDVKKLRQQADYVVVNFHWGEELAEYPDEWQRELAHRVIEAGANLIVGHHPHVLQGIEQYRGATIAYSLGNFVFGGNARHSYDTAVLKVVLNGNQPSVELLPVSVVRWQPRLAEGESAMNILQLVQERSSLLQNSTLPNAVTK